MKLDKKMAIIAGEGLLPAEVYARCKKEGIESLVICIKGQSSPNIYEACDVVEFPVHAVSNILTAIHASGAKQVVLAGKVKRPKLSKLLLDLNGAKLFAKIMMRGISDDALLSAIVEFLEENRLKVLPADQIVSDIFADKGSMTKIKPKASEMDDIIKGKKILRDISKHDMGQALVIQAGLVLGVEAAEGTDELIIRSGLIQQKIPEKPVLIKMLKAHQSHKVDLPCIGVHTIEQIHQSGVRGVAVEAGKTYILSRAETVARANELKVFIYGF